MPNGFPVDAPKNHASPRKTAMDYASKCKRFKEGFPPAKEAIATPCFMCEGDCHGDVVDDLVKLTLKYNDPALCQTVGKAAGLIRDLYWENRKLRNKIS
jgi:hypothetical protein